MAKIDMKDRRLLSEMDMDAKAPIKSIARRCRLSRQVTQYRINKLQTEKVAFGSLTIFDSCAAGYKWYRVVLSLYNITKAEKQEFLDHLSSNKFVFWLGEVGGNWDVVVNFICRDHFHFNSIFEEIMQKYGKHVRRHEILIYIDVHDLSRAYILPSDAPRKEFYHSMKYNPKLKLDSIDESIIGYLSKDSSATDSKIAKAIGISSNTVRVRIKKMMENQFILGFRLFINPSRIEYHSHMVFLEISQLDLNAEQGLLNYAKSTPNVTFFVRHIGRWRIGMEIEAKTEAEFQEIFVNIRTRFSSLISGFESFPIYSDRVINYFPSGNLTQPI